MDMLDETVFGVLFSFLNARNASCLGSTCTSFRRWVVNSPMWRQWSEEAFPSLKTTPAKEFVDLHDGRKAFKGLRRWYKQLFLGLYGLPGAKLPTVGPAQLGAEASQPPEIGDFIVTLDVEMQSGHILSHSASCEGMNQDPDKSDRAGICFRGLFRTACSAEEERKLRTEIQGLAKDAPRRVNVRCLYSPGPRVPSWHTVNLLCKADGQVSRRTGTCVAGPTCMWIRGAFCRDTT
jgi:hypothetical protein